MIQRTPLAAICLTLLCATTPLPAQVIQLPSVQTFSYSGSVLVPDRGTTSLGSVSRASNFSRRSGFPGAWQGQSNRASSASHSGLSVSATILDLDEWDRQLRGVSKMRPPSIHPGAVADRGALTRTKTRVPDANDRVSQTEAAKAMVRRARRYLKTGEMSRAKIAYQMAIADLEGPLKEFAIREYREIFIPDVR